jgi:hypothetical protein
VDDLATFRSLAFLDPAAYFRTDPLNDAQPMLDECFGILATDKPATRCAVE